MTVTNQLTAQDLTQSARELCRKTWWVYLLGGIASVAFGVIALMKPGAALLVIAMFFAAYLIIDGAFNFASAVTHRSKQGWGMMMLFGLLSVVLGGYMLAVPPVSMIAVVYTVAIVSLFFGATQILLGIKVRKEIKGEWVLYLTGLMSLLFGLLILFRVDIGGLTIIYMIAFWALTIGVLRIIFAFRARAFGLDASLV
jgi:uncharacterized membrane protein HdeD (DUF308 family)